MNYDIESLAQICKFVLKKIGKGVISLTVHGFITSYY